MIDRDTQGILAAEHRELRGVTSRLAAEVNLLREIVEAARRHECGAAYQDSVWALIVAYDEAFAEVGNSHGPVTRPESRQDARASAVTSPDTPGSGESP